MGRWFYIFCISLILSSCVTSSKTDYGDYPVQYQSIIQSFYSDIIETNKVEIIQISNPIQYDQSIKDWAFSTHLDLKHSPGNRSGERLSGYLICVSQTNHDNGYKVDAILIKNNVVISRISDVGNRLVPLCQVEIRNMLNYAKKQSDKESNDVFNKLFSEMRKSKKSSKPRPIGTLKNKRVHIGYGSSCDCGYGYCYGLRGGRYCITSGGNKSYR